MKEVNSFQNATSRAQSLRGSSVEKADSKKALAPLKKEAWSEEQSMELAEEALREEVGQEIGEEEALSETLELMSLRLGSRVYSDRIKDEKQRVRNTRYKKALTSLSKGQFSDETLSDWFEALMASETRKGFEQALDSESMDTGKKLLLSSELLKREDLPSKKRKWLESAQEEWLKDPKWGMQACAFVEVVELRDDELKQLNTLYRSIKEASPEATKGLSAWFDKVRGWERREAKVRVLMRGLALELSVGANRDEQAKMAGHLEELQRLHLFLGLEEESAQVEQMFGLPKDSVLKEAILLLDQSWVHTDWLKERAHHWGVEEEEQHSFLNSLYELMELLPVPCFSGEGQRKQLLEGLREAVVEPRYPRHPSLTEAPDPTALPQGWETLDPRRV